MSDGLTNTPFTAYSFLDPEKEHAKLAGYIIAVGVAECLAFLLARGLTWIRIRLSRRTAFASSSDSEAQPAIDEDWQNVERPGSSVGHAV